MVVLDWIGWEDAPNPTNSSGF